MLATENAPLYTVPPSLSSQRSVFHVETAKAVSGLLRLLRESNVLHQERAR